MGTQLIATRRPRTSLIDAEWEWLAHRAPTPGTGTAFQPPSAAELALELSGTLKSAAPEPRASTQRRPFGVRRALAIGATALISFGLGVCLLQIGAPLWEQRYAALQPVSHSASMGQAWLGSPPAAATDTKLAPSAAPARLGTAGVAQPIGRVAESHGAGLRRRAEVGDGKPKPRPSKATSKAVSAEKRVPSRRPRSDNPY